MDSVAQAGGRCNRHGRHLHRPVYIVNLAEENLRMLPEIKEAQNCTETVLDNFKAAPASLGNDLLSPEAIGHYYQKYFFQRKAEMTYPLKPSKKPKSVPVATSILDLLSCNPQGKEAHRREANADGSILFHKQAFSTAAQHFQVIDAPTSGLVVPYGEEGQTLIRELAAAFASDDIPLSQQIPLLRRAQQFSVNIFPHTHTKLLAANAIHEVPPNSGIFFLDAPHYHTDLGMTHDVFSDF